MNTPRWVRKMEQSPTAMGLFTGAVLVGLLALLMLTTGCAAPEDDEAAGRATEALDGAGTKACDAWAEWLAGDEEPATRPDVAHEVLDLAIDSRSGALADKAELLVKPAVYDSNENWALAADALAYECQVLGWKP